MIPPVLMRDRHEPMREAYRELQAARTAYEGRLHREPFGGPSQRRRWPERVRFVAAEREYLAIARAIYGGRSVWGTST